MLLISHLCEWNQGCLHSSLTLALHSAGGVANSCPFLLLNSLDLCTEMFPFTPWQASDHRNLVADSKSLPNMKTQLARRGYDKKKNAPSVLAVQSNPDGLHAYHFNRKLLGEKKTHTVFMLTDLYREISKQYSVVVKLYNAQII